MDAAKLLLTWQLLLLGTTDETMSATDPNERTCYVTGIHEKVTKILLEELFIQMGPLETVVLRPVGETTGKRPSYRYALIVFKDEESVLFAVECMDGIRMFGVELSVRPKHGTEQERKYKEKIQQRRLIDPSIPVAQGFYNREAHYGGRSPVRVELERESNRRVDLAYTPNAPVDASRRSHHWTPYSRRTDKRRVTTIRMDHSGQNWVPVNLQRDFSENDWNVHSPIPICIADTRAYRTPTNDVWTPISHAQRITTPRDFHSFRSAPDLSRHWDPAR